MPPNFITRVSVTRGKGIRAIGLVLLVLAGCGGGGGGHGSSSAKPAAPRPQPGSPAAPAVPPEVSRLPVAQKVGALFVVTPGIRLPREAGRPLVVADGNRARAAGLPTGPGAVAGGPAPAEAGATRAARALRRGGIGAALAPSANVAVPAGALAARSFSEDPAEVADLVRAEVDGLRQGGVAPVVGDFPGAGSASADPNLQTATVGAGLPDLRSHDLVPFRAVLATAPAVQLSNSLYAAYDGVTPATLLPEVAQDLLRGELHFPGAAISPDLAAVVQVTQEPIERLSLDALRAGTDGLLVTSVPDARTAYAAVLAAARDGKLPAARLDEAVGRMLVLRRSAARRTRGPA